MKEERILKSLETLAAKLGTTADKIYETYQKEAKLYKVYYFIRIIVSLFITLVGIIGLVYIFIDINYDWFDSGLIDTIAIILIVVMSIGVVAIIVNLFFFEEYVRSIKNPEHMAMRNILETIF